MMRQKPKSSMSRDKQHTATLLFGPKTLLDVMRWLSRLGVPPCDRHDVAGDVWLCAISSWHNYDPNLSRPERWLNRIAVHAVAHYRGRAYHRREVLMRSLPRVVDDAPDVVSLLGAVDTRMDLVAALESIDPELASAVVKHDLDGIPMADIARSMEIPISTLYKVRKRALVALRAELDRRLSNKALH